MNIALFDYGAGNLHSLGKALEAAGASVTITDRWEQALVEDGQQRPRRITMRWVAMVAHGLGQALDLGLVAAHADDRDPIFKILVFVPSRII